MNGLKAWVYFLAYYIDFVLSAAISAVVFLLFAAIFRLEVVSINPGPVILLLLVWINTAVSLSFALSALWGNARNALIATFLLLLISIFICGAAISVWNVTLPNAFFIWPMFACYTALSIINVRAISLGQPALTIQTMSSEPKLVAALAYLAVEWVIFLLLAFYGHVLLPV